MSRGVYPQFVQSANTFCCNVLRQLLGREVHLVLQYIQSPKGIDYKKLLFYNNKN